MPDNSDCVVGYKRPPKHTRFRPGQSGNPRGRRKNVPNFKTDLLDELNEQIPIRENGRDLKVSKQRAFIKALVAAAIKGDMRATSALVSVCTRSLGAQIENEVDPSPSAEDIEIIEAFLARERKREREQGDAQSAKTNLREV
jgi:hypothetical protein